MHRLEYSDGRVHRRRTAGRLHRLSLAKPSSGVDRAATAASVPAGRRRSAPAGARSGRDQDGPWHTEAVCRRDEAGLFFAPSKEPTAARLSREEAAKRVCARCPVMVECREHALLQPEPYGVWGGLTAAERRVVLARRRRREVELQEAPARGRSPRRARRRAGPTAYRTGGAPPPHAGAPLRVGRVPSTAVRRSRDRRELLRAVEVDRAVRAQLRQPVRRSRSAGSCRTSTASRSSRWSRSPTR